MRLEIVSTYSARFLLEVPRLPFETYPGGLFLWMLRQQTILDVMVVPAVRITPITPVV